MRACVRACVCTCACVRECMFACVLVCVCIRIKYHKLYMNTWTLKESVVGSKDIGIVMILKRDSDTNALLASSTFSGEDSTYTENDPRATC